MEIIKAITKRGLELRGAIYGDTANDTALIMFTDICSNVFQDDFLDATGKLLSQNGITVIIGHTQDSFSAFAHAYRSTGTQIHTGAFNTDFNTVYEDVETWALHARKMKFKNIILAGHSIGSNKIINYLGNTKDNFVNYFIASCPIDIMYWKSITPNIKECYGIARIWSENDKGDDILPMLFGDYSPMTAKTVVDFFDTKNLKNCPVLSNEGEVKSLYNIKPNGTFFIGSKDSISGECPKTFIEQINNWTKRPKDNQVLVIEDANHTFSDKHDIYAQTVLNCIQNHWKKANN